MNLTVCKDNWTPLHLAALGGHTETARALVEFNVNKEARDEKNKTPLHLVVLIAIS